MIYCFGTGVQLPTAPVWNEKAPRKRGFFVGEQAFRTSMMLGVKRGLDDAPKPAGRGPIGEQDLAREHPIMLGRLHSSLQFDVYSLMSKNGVQ